MEIRDDKGAILAADSRIFAGSVSSNIAKARAILEGLHLATNMIFFPLYIELDALNVINLCNEVNVSLGEVDKLIFDIKTLLSRFSGQVLFLLFLSFTMGWLMKLQRWLFILIVLLFGMLISPFGCLF
ncbi:hypothetical protein ACOSP7_018378 [Xanthoceras sorbifolium]